MSLEAGSVYTILGGRFNPAAFEQFDAANKKAAADATTAESRLSAAGQRLSSAHERVAASAEKVASSGARIAENAPLKAMDQWAKTSSQAEKNLGTLGTVASKTAAVGILAVGAATIYAASKATTFNREMLKISTQAGGSAAEVKQLSQAVLSMAGSVPQGPQKLAEGLYHIESAGFRGTQAMSMLKAAAEGAALGNANLEATTQAMIATMASQIKGVHGSADAMGQLNDIVGVGDMRMEALAQAMATGILPTAHDAGLSLKDVGAALATVTDNATPANVTATRLRMTLALMAAPSKAATKQLESIGLTSTSLAHDMRQPNGLLKAVEDLKTHLRDSGKTAEEQDAILSKTFGGGKSSAVIHTLISETDRLRNKYDQLGASNGPAKLAKSWAEFQKSESASFGELKSGAEAFAITVGNVVLPELTKLSHEATHALDGFVKSGGAKAAGEDLVHVFDEIGQVVGNVAGPLASVAEAMVAVGKAAGLGNATEVSALLAGFLAFKSATFVAPILTAIAGAISEVGVAAATAPSIAAFGGDLVALAGGPVGAAALALGVLAAGFVALNSGLFSSQSAAEKNAAALEHDQKAVEGLANATQSAAEAHTNAERAELRHKEAGEQLKKVEKEVADGTLKGAAAQNALLNARLNDAETSEAVASARKKALGAVKEEQKESEKAKNTLGGRQREILKEIDTTNKQIAAAKQTAAGRKELGMLTEKLKAQEQAYGNAAKIAAQYEAQLAVAEESRRRIQASKSAITPENAMGVKQLQDQLFEAGAPKKVVARYELEDQGAQAQLGGLATKLANLGQQTFVAKVLTTAPTAAIGVLALTAALHGVPPSKVIRIMTDATSKKVEVDALKASVRGVPASKIVAIETNASSEAQKVAELKAQIAALESKSITVTTVLKTVGSIGKGVGNFLKHASGRPGGAAEAAVVGEGRGPEYVIDAGTGQGMKVTQPTLMGLGHQDYVVPLEDRYRGRALGLFAALAKDLGVPGYSGGRGPKASAAKRKTAPTRGTPMPVPDAIKPLSLPLSDIEQKQAAAKSRYDKAASKVNSLEGKLSSAERTLRYASPKSRAKDSNRVHELQAELAKAKRSHDYTVEHHKLQEWNKTLQDAKAYQTKINKATLQANNARNAMQLAAEHGNVAGYNTAKGQRVAALGNLQTLIKEAQAQVKTGSEYALTLEGQLQSAELEEGQTSAESPAAAPALSPTQVAEEKAIEREVALAALTQGLGDDEAAGKKLVAFFENALSSAIGRGASDEVVTELAGQVKTARSNLESLSGNGSNSNPDVQAQITQANERAAVAQRAADIANQALAVFGGPGDIGAGGSNARDAAAGITINTLHPGDPATLRAIGDAAVSGMGLQGSRRAVRQQVGP